MDIYNAGKKDKNGGAAFCLHSSRAADKCRAGDLYKGPSITYVRNSTCNFTCYLDPFPVLACNTQWTRRRSLLKAPIKGGGGYTDINKYIVHVYMHRYKIKLFM